MTARLPHRPGDLVAFGGAGPRTAAHLAADVGRIAAALAAHPPGEVVVVCADRYLFACALLGAWSAGHAVSLPPSSRPAVVEALAAGPSVRALLHDLPEQAAGTRIQELLGGAAPAWDLTLPPPGRRVVTLSTSGSTGQPVAVHKTAAALLDEAACHLRVFGLGAQARWVVTVPPFHIYGLLFGVLTPLAAGAAFGRVTPLHAESVLAELRAVAATHLVSAPAHLAGLAELPGLAAPELAAVFSSGAPLPGPVARGLRQDQGWRVVEVFGSTETGGIGWRDGPERPWTPLPGVAVSAGAEGQLAVDSPFLPPDLPRPVACADRVALREDGTFDLLGRADGVVKVAGKRIALREVEERLRALPGVRDAAVLAAPADGPRGVELWAAVATERWTPAALRAALATWLDPVTVPRRFRTVAALPRTPSGKLPRAELEALFASPAAPAPPPFACGPVRATLGPAGEEVREVEVGVPPELPWFRGHFEGCPILPGIAQVEALALAQARGCWPDLGALAGVQNLKFKRLVRPGAALLVHLDRRPGAARVRFALSERGEACSSGVLVFGPPAPLPPAPPAASTP